jgi:hypothetical protein
MLGMMDKWLGRTDLQNQSTPQGQNYASLRSGILNNFINPNQYNTGDALTSNYAWMAPMQGAANAMSSMMNPQAAQSPVGQAMQQTGTPGPNLRQQLFLANQAMSDYENSKIPPVDMSVRGMPDKAAGARSAAKAFYDRLDQINKASHYANADYNVGTSDLVSRIQGTLNSMMSLQPGGGGWNSNGMIPMGQDFISRYGL